MSVQNKIRAFLYAAAASLWCVMLTLNLVRGDYVLIPLAIFGITFHVYFLITDIKDAQTQFNKGRTNG